VQNKKKKNLVERLTQLLATYTKIFGTDNQQHILSLHAVMLQVIMLNVLLLSVMAPSGSCKSILTSSNWRPTRNIIGDDIL
jgi:hypothetical protein